MAQKTIFVSLIDTTADEMKSRYGYTSVEELLNDSENLLDCVSDAKYMLRISGIRPIALRVFSFTNREYPEVVSVMVDTCLSTTDMAKGIVDLSHPKKSAETFADILEQAILDLQSKY